MSSTAALGPRQYAFTLEELSERHRPAVHQNAPPPLVALGRRGEPPTHAELEVIRKELFIDDSGLLRKRN